VAAGREHSKFVRGKTTARAWIEDTVLRRYEAHYND